MGCRKRAPVTELLRVVARNGELVPDPRRRLPGRGASLHPTPECLHAAERRRAFVRALRCSAPLEVGPVRSHVLGVSPEAHAGAEPERAQTARQTRSSTVGPAPGRPTRREQDVVG
ncbi:YlxR family protein [Geodermatophilus sp. URMC 64]